MSEVQLAKARLLPEGGEPIEVQFNPATLQLEISNQLEQQNRDGTRRQLVTASSSRLALELPFDTSTDGRPVRELTLPLQRLVRPEDLDRHTEQAVVPPLVRFEWGSFAFAGYVESYREQLDFFSAEGVPLRSLVSLAITQQSRPPDPPPTPRRRPLAPPVRMGSCNPVGVDGAAGLSGGDSAMARAIAGLNGEESLRRSGQREMAVPGGGARPRGAVGGAEPADVGQHAPLAERLSRSTARSL